MREGEPRVGPLVFCVAEDASQHARTPEAHMVAHDALRIAGGAGGVDDLQRLADVVHTGVDALGWSAEHLGQRRDARQVAERRRVGFTALESQQPLEIGHLLANGQDLPGIVVAAEDPAGAGVAQQEGQLVGPGSGIDRNEDAAGE